MSHVAFSGGKAWQLIKSPGLQVPSNQISKSLSTKIKTRLMTGSKGCSCRKALMRRMEQSVGCGWLKSINIIDQISINEINHRHLSSTVCSEFTTLWISSVLALNPSHLHFLECKACKGGL